MSYSSTLNKLDRILTTQVGMTEEAVRLVDDLRGDDRPSPINDLLFVDPPPLDGAVDDPRVRDLYQLLWDHREDVLATLYEPDRVFISRALHKLVLEVPADSRLDPASLLEAAKGRFFLRIRDKWSRVRIEEVPTGRGSSESVVKSTDGLLTGILREMRQRGLLDEIEVPVQ